VFDELSNSNNTVFVPVRATVSVLAVPPLLVWLVERLAAFAADDDV
jgi:uncharacterized protein YqjF (DUF2071 family)